MFWQTLYQTEGDLESANITNALDSAKFVSSKNNNTLPYLRGIHNKGIVFPITTKVCTILTRSFGTHSLGIQISSPKIILAFNSHGGRNVEKMFYRCIIPQLCLLQQRLHSHLQTCKLSISQDKPTLITLGMAITH